MRHNYYSTIVHRFRILVVGKVSVVYPITQAVDSYTILARLWQVLTHQSYLQCGYVGMCPVVFTFLPRQLMCVAFIRGPQ